MKSIRRLSIIGVLVLYEVTCLSKGALDEPDDIDVNKTCGCVFILFG